MVKRKDEAILHDKKISELGQADKAGKAGQQKTT